MRLQNIVELKPLKSEQEANGLHEFYLREARRRATEEAPETWGPDGSDPLQTKAEVADVYSLLAKQAVTRAQEGVTQRDFLNALHSRTEDKFVNAQQAA